MPGSGGRPPRIRIKTPDAPPAPKLALAYDGPLPAPNLFARMYLYEWIVRFEDVRGLGCPAARLDILHEWDHVLAGQLLRRFVVRLGALSTLSTGQPVSGTADVVRLLRRHTRNPASHVPWAAALALAAHFHVPPCDLAEVDVPLRAAAEPPARRVVSAPVLPPRRTRNTARLEAAVAALNDAEDPEATPGVRRSLRAESRAAQQRRDELRERAQRALAPPRSVSREASPDAEDAAATPVHLEAKIACLVRLCDALCVSQAAPRAAPAQGTSIMHRLIQPMLDDAAAIERHERQQAADVEAQCSGEMRELLRKAPSMTSKRYPEWKRRRKELDDTHVREVLAAGVQMDLALRRATPRSGPLGRDMHGNEYWHMLPIAHEINDPAGHWSHMLLVYGPGLSSKDASSADPDDAPAPSSAPASADVGAATSDESNDVVVEVEASDEDVTGGSVPAPAQAEAASDATAREAPPSTPMSQIYGTSHAADVDALIAHIQHRVKRKYVPGYSDDKRGAEQALLPNLLSVRNYLAWAHADDGDEEGTSQP